jgi:K+-dependent Na+/Ca+ exchanger-like protein
MAASREDEIFAYAATQQAAGSASASSAAGASSAPPTGTSLSIFDDAFADQGMAELGQRSEEAFTEARNASEAYNKLWRKMVALAMFLVTVIVVVSLLGVIVYLHGNPTTDKKPEITNLGAFGTPSSKAEIRICTRSQAFLVWVNGHLVGTGTECELHFSSPAAQLEAPCDKPLLIAVEGQDFEWGGGGDSRAGIIAEVRWCGKKFVTGKNWRCSMVAQTHWMRNWDNHSKPAAVTGSGSDKGVMSTTNDCRSEGFLPALTENHTCGDTKTNGKTTVCGDAPDDDDDQAHHKHISPSAKWIWAGNGSGASSGAVEWSFTHVDSAYCRFQSTNATNEIISRSEGCAGLVDPAARDDKLTKAAYIIEHPGADKSTENSETGLMAPEDLGKVTCAPGYHARREVKATCAHYATEATDADKVPEFVFDGCCPDFLWFFESTNWGVGIMAFSLMSYVFIAFHIVCDDFFVPALNVMCETIGLSDDIAGATFMAAGASSPELFASLIGVLTNSAVGAGTVVGSELFNMLVIIGGVCLVTPKPLNLDWRPLSREVFFFSLSLIMILVVLNDGIVEVREAVALLSGYALYVLVCALFKPIVRTCCPPPEHDEMKREIDADGRIQEVDDAKATSLPEGNLIGDARMPTPITTSMMDESLTDGASGEVLAHGFLFKKSEFHSKARNTKGVWQQRWMVLDDESFRYTRKNGRDRVIVAGAQDWAECTVESVSRTQFDLITPSGDALKTTLRAAQPLMAQQWVQQLKAHIARNRKLSVEERAQSAAAAAGGHGEGGHGHNILEKPGGGGVGLFMWYLTLPILVCLRFTVPDVRNPKRTKLYPLTMILSVCWLAFLAEFMMNSAESCGEALLPVDDDRACAAQLARTFVSDQLWLSNRVQILGCIAGVADDIMGLTVTAAGTSLPNLFASTIVAGQGLGNMAVSNAFGSNTFNIFIALALPWFIGGVMAGSKDGGKYEYAPCVLQRSRLSWLSCAVLSQGRRVNTLADSHLSVIVVVVVAMNRYAVPKGSIFLSCEILGLVLVGIVACIAAMNFRIDKTLAWPFMIM